MLLRPKHTKQTIDTTVVVTFVVVRLYEVHIQTLQLNSWSVLNKLNKTEYNYSTLGYFGGACLIFTIWKIHMRPLFFILT